MNREIILKELKSYEEYSSESLEKKNDDELAIIFNNHCKKYAQKIKASEVHNLQGTVAIDTPDGYQLLGDYWIKNNKEIYSVKVNGKITKVSGDHLFQTQSGWKYTKDLTTDDYILTKEGLRLIEYIRKHDKSEETYDWEVLHENHRYWTASGLSSHNTGKTYLLLNMCREAQKMGYFIIYYDSENAVDGELAAKFGVDLSMFRYEPVQTIQEFRSNVTNIIDTLIEQKEAGNEIPKLFIALDSAGNLASQKEIDDAKAYSDKADMSRAKMMKSVFRIMMSKLGLIGGSFIFTNHIYKSLDLYSQDIQSGGCLIPGSKVLMSDGTYKNIEDIKEGDFVMTLHGGKEILKTWEFEKPTYTVEFEDDSSITCSEDHRFYIGDETDDVNDDNNWIYARTLIAGNEVKRFAVELNTLKVKSVRENSSMKVNDLTVADVQHYITDNGVINHNTGLVYGASIILNMTKAKLKEGTEQTGIVVTAKPQKNRFCVPVAVKFHISYQKGMNKYVGLQEYMSWDGCGVGRGKFITAKEYSKLSESDKEKCRKHPMDDDTYYLASDTGRYICTDFQLEPFKWADVCSAPVWPESTIKRLDENVIKDIFAYSDSKNNYDIGIILNDDSNFEDADDTDSMIKNQLDD